MKTRSVFKEVLKAGSVCVLAVAVFAAGFMGFNRLTFAAATSEATPLYQAAAEVITFTPPYETAVACDAEVLYEVDETEAVVFVPPTLIVTIGEWHDDNVPAGALPMEEAAQIGARYIWDVFGKCIDGAEAKMMFSSTPAMINTWWMGSVVVGEYEFRFTVNGITGERIEISRSGGPQVINEVRWIDEMDEDIMQQIQNARNMLIRAGWFDMDIAEQIEFAQVSPEIIETYMNTAQELAERHFNRTEVVHLELEELHISKLHISRLILGGGGEFIIDSLSFIAIDETGREARISLSASSADDYIGFTFISTQP